MANIYHYRTEKDIISDNIFTSHYGEKNIQIIPTAGEKPPRTPDWMHGHKLHNMDFDSVIIDMEAELKTNPNFQAVCRETGMDKIRQECHELMVLRSGRHDKERDSYIQNAANSILNNMEFKNGIGDLIFSDSIFNILTPEEYKNAEAALNFLNEAGNILPDRLLNDYVSSGGLVQVSSYVRRDGTEVKAYTRRAPSK